MEVRVTHIAGNALEGRLGGPELKHSLRGGAPWVNLPAILWIDLPEAQIDADATVIKVELDGPLRLYTGSGTHVTTN